MNLDIIREKQGFICDMDGVLYHGNQLLEGAKEFVAWLIRENKRFLFLTNSSERTPVELKQKLARMDIDVDESHFYTSALATAAFIANQAPGCSAYVIGDAGLLNALYSVGITMNNVNPDYVIVGETKNYNFDNIATAVGLVKNGAKLIGTNPDIVGPVEGGMVPACRALVAPIEMATSRQAYFIGKPNPLMLRTGVKLLGCKREDTAIIGDRMDTDIICGIESEIDTVLVLSGVSTLKTLKQFPYGPKYILDNVGNIVSDQASVEQE